MNAIHFDQKKYWQSRVSGNIDLGVVGYRSLGRGYNEYIYRRRLDVLDEFLREYGKPVEELRVLDIGCGSGFYVDYWQKRGVRNLMGVDISAESISLMGKLYPEYSFVNLDVTSPNVFSGIISIFDIITIFDVIYHVIDDDQASQLLVNAVTILAENGEILITDCPSGRNYGFVKHVRFRSINFYEQIFKEGKDKYVKRYQLFNLIQPPIVRIKGIDYCISGLYYIFGIIYRVHDIIGRTFGRLFYNLDKTLLNMGIRFPNQELLVIGKKKNEL